MIGFEHLAVDGQKIQGNASYKKSKTVGKMKKEYDRLKKGIEKIETLENQLAKLAGLISQFDVIAGENERINMTDVDAKMMAHVFHPRNPFLSA
jgi:hypothetical protein